MPADLIYEERVNSNWTTALFAGLALVFGLLLLRRASAGGLDVLAAGLLFLCGIFLFYTVNFRTLVIRLDPEALTLLFGIFSWTVRLDNVADCRLDEISTILRLGGAGIHFMFVRKRYRASFNFLEHSRVVIALKRKAGPVRDISFSTRQPDEVLRLVREAAIAKQAGRSALRDLG